MFSDSQTSDSFNETFSLLAYKDNRKGKRFPEGFRALCIIIDFIVLRHSFIRLFEGLYPSRNMLNYNKLNSNSM